MLELRDIHLEIDGKVILKRLNMKFEIGKRYTVLGNNGTGKSTVANMIMGMEDYRPQSGRIYLDGVDITDLDMSKRAQMGITIAFQENVRFDGIRVLEYLTLGGKIKKSLEEMKNALKLVGLGDEYLKRYVDGSLSGGERKRIELASIYMLDPKYVILDEPDSGIDMMSIETINKFIDALIKRKIAVITITHREEIAINSDYAYLLCAGIVLKEGDPVEISKYYKSMCDACDHPNEIHLVKEREMI
ncbi:ATP-binding cassette domain-containing protein [Athalassotoga saccharophila]|uniref:ATP-binding cassette domain-containing protein n=1 Tax=Athalassotoga saccharophila TaxID=1441386 RepID=UPI00137B4394|nr:ABC transporter ATP-binding protein [Athalassotoga saccharophila]BBJ28390.1 iron-sulfur cluster assembly ATPase protein SufC [Athalassotoga saccharophila]